MGHKRHHQGSPELARVAWDELVVGSLGSDDLLLRPRGVGMASISERESREIEAANASGTAPVVF
ncbi:MAG: hypothetical protein ABWZ36_03085, partial [Jiangellaceae bacterium]